MLFHTFQDISRNVVLILVVVTAKETFYQSTDKSLYWSFSILQVERPKESLLQYILLLYVAL